MHGVKVGELCPGHTDNVAVLGIGSRSPCRTAHTSSGGKISSSLQNWQLHVTHGAGGCTGLKSSGKGQGKGQERESRP